MLQDLSSLEVQNTQGRYTQLPDKNQSIDIRILSTQALNGWRYFTTTAEGKAKPVVSLEKPNTLIAPFIGQYGESKLKQFVALIVWNHSTNQVEVATIDKASIIEGFMATIHNQKWVNNNQSFTDFDFTITRIEKSYNVTPNPASELSVEVREKAIAELSKINLTKLLDGESPFVE